MIRKRDLLSLIEYFKRVEEGKEKLDEKFSLSNYYHITNIVKANLTEKGNLRITCYLEFIPIKSGIKETLMGYTHFEVNNLPIAKLIYLKRENVLTNEKLNTYFEIEKKSDHEIILKAKYEPSLRVGERVKWKYSVLFKNYPIMNEDSYTIQVGSPTRYIKLLIYLPRIIKNAEVYKTIAGFKATTGKSPLLTEKHTFLISNNMIKLELWDVHHSAYKVEWKLEE
ncbi:hypothetical protein SJAV_27550 [Sulfurisphaera javensis]|uniref:Uncharacterized protein n=1 Tax=Sulfurisphaera javensis TaxID=2049879 RepID=A0AAT9GVE5_9CREN